MEIIFFDQDDLQVAELVSVKTVISDLSEALDLLGNSYYQGASAILVKKEHFHPDFYILKTGMAGDILQKFSNYSLKLAIIGDFVNPESTSLKEFIYESNRFGRIIFAGSREDALKALLKK